MKVKLSCKRDIDSTMQASAKLRWSSCHSSAEALDVATCTPDHEWLKSTRSCHLGSGCERLLHQMRVTRCQISVTTSACYRHLSKTIVRRKNGNETVKHGESLPKGLQEFHRVSSLTLQQLCGGICKMKLAP